MPASDSSSSSHRATHPRLHIRNAQEAHTLFEAVRLNLLPIVRRRLSPTDRELSSGEVFVWEEASYKGGLERWTDGRKWSQSRMREPFLFYEEKALPSQEERNAKAARRARKSSDASSPSPSPPPSPTPRRQDRPTKVKGLTKQTYSAYVTPPGSSGPPKKWHLTAYFSSSDYHELPVVNEDPVLRTITVPADVYVTGKGLTRKNNTRGVSSAATSTRTASVAPPPPPPSAPSDGSRSPWSSASSDPMPPTPPQPPMHFYPTPPAYTYDTGRYPICSPPLAPGYITSDVRGEYPPVSVPAPAPQPPSPGARYSARHTLDQRALGAFRITL